MSAARDRLWELCQTPDTASAFGDALDDLLREHAQMLARRIRAERGSTSLESGHHFFNGMDYAAGLIDPHAGPVRPDEEPT
ncbi:hypothetical protein [Streptomyces sp. NPDC085596]|uniref:hypothetical protein n=1 Tax=Streptomyces sp. NPDC085596 TaxID=3365731 RepID=UPI0037CE3638